MGILLNKIIQRTKKVTPDEIAELITSPNTSLIGDVLNFAKERGENNTTPNTSSSSGVMSRFDGSSYWNSRTGITTGRCFHGGASITSDLSLIYGGSSDASTANVANTERYSNSSNAWSNRSPVVELFLIRSNMGFALNSDLALSTGGYNGVYQSVVSRYSNMGNTWTNRNSMTYTSIAHGASPFTSDIGITHHGYNGNTMSTMSAYTDSVNAWATRTSGNYALRRNLGTSFSSDLALSAGGENGSTPTMALTERYSYSSNSWVSRNSGNSWSSFVQGGFSQTSDLSTASGGYSALTSSSVTSTSRFSDSANIWTSKTNGLADQLYGQQNSLSSSLGLYTGGNAAQTSCNRYTDMEVNLKSGLSFISNTIPNTPAIPNTENSQHVCTNSLMTSNPGTIFVTTLEDKFATDIPATTYDVSPDGGTTWSLSEQPINIPVNISALSVTDLRLRFNLKRSLYGANTWMARTPLTIARQYASNLKFTSDLAMVINGRNGVYMSTSELIQDSTNAVSSKAADAASYQRGCGSLTSDLGHTFAGGNPGALTTNSRYSFSANAWISRQAFPNASSTNAPHTTSITSDYTMSAGGWSPYSNQNYRYSDSANNWTSRGSALIASTAGGAAALSSDAYIILPGDISGSPSHSDVSRYNDSSNSWVARNGIATPTTEGAIGCSLFSDGVVKVGGGSAASGVRTERFSDSGNMWVNRINAIDPHYYTGGQGGVGLTSNVALAFSGMNSSSYSPFVERFTDGEHYFKGFALR